MTKCDLVNGPCACGAWHYPNDGTFGQPGMWSNRLPNGGDPAPPIDALIEGFVVLHKPSDASE